MWDLFINPLTTILVLLYQLLGNNTTLAIIVLTVILRLVMYPIFAAQQETAQKQAALAPELEAIKEKYKDDREKQMQAQQELYQREGINIFGGCLPMLLQLPIFIGLYTAINLAVAATPFELIDIPERLLIPGLQSLFPLHSTFLGMNLTLPPAPPNNPIYAYAMPILVAVTTYLQFKVSTGQRPQTATPKKEGQIDQAAQMQQSMSWTMPLMYGFISYSASVGLSIYFLVGNIVGIIQYVPAVKSFLDTIFLRKKKAETTETTAAVEPVVKSTKKSVGKTN
jgi:YidC/Oxa1 family membrane protein insertase